MSKPMWLTDQFVDRPGTTFGVGIIIVLALVGASFGLGYFQVNKVHERDFLVWSSEAVYNYDLWKLSRVYLAKNDGST